MYQTSVQRTALHKWFPSLIRHTWTVIKFKRFRRGGILCCSARYNCCRLILQPNRQSDLSFIAEAEFVIHESSSVRKTLDERGCAELLDFQLTSTVQWARDLSIGRLELSIWLRNLDSGIMLSEALPHKISQTPTWCAMPSNSFSAQERTCLIAILSKTAKTVVVRESKCSKEDYLSHLISINFSLYILHQDVRCFLRVENTITCIQIVNGTQMTPRPTGQ